MLCVYVIKHYYESIRRHWIPQKHFHALVKRLNIHIWDEVPAPLLLRTRPESSDVLPERPWGPRKLPEDLNSNKNRLVPLLWRNLLSLFSVSLQVIVDLKGSDCTWSYQTPPSSPSTTVSRKSSMCRLVTMETESVSVIISTNLHNRSSCIWSLHPAWTLLPPCGAEVELHHTNKKLNHNHNFNTFISYYFYLLCVTL